MDPQHLPSLENKLATKSSTQPDWMRIFPAADHRWVMGLRPGEVTDFLASRDATGAVRSERSRWLEEDVTAYAALLPEAEPALHETVELARSLGMAIDESLPAWQLLLALGQGWEVDFAWMHPDGQGTHRLVGGVVCFPSSWAIRDKLGRPMSEVHEPVPGLNAALARNIETFFARQEPGVVWTRENASFSRDAELNHHPSRRGKPLDATVTVEEVFIRLEHQLLLKFARSGSILFGIRVEIVPLKELMPYPNITSRLSQLIATISPAAAAYKGLAEVRTRLVTLLGEATESRPV